MLTVANSIIRFNHHTWATLTLWWRSCDVVLLLLLINKMPDWMI